MNSLEFIKMYVDEWPSDTFTKVKLLCNGCAYFFDTVVGGVDVDLSEHFAPDYYDGKMWTREDFESFGDGDDSSIEWEDASVCYADGDQWFESGHESLVNESGDSYEYDSIVDLGFDDFQLNEPRIGDYLEASELDTEQKYNDSVEVFGLFGFDRRGNYQQYKESIDTWADFLVLGNDKRVSASREDGRNRFLTYKQLMAIGKLKKMLNKGEDTLSVHFIGLDKAIHSCDFDKIVFHSDKILEFSPNPTDGEKVSTKASKAYNLLKSMDIYYDEDLKLWYKKEFL